MPPGVDNDKNENGEWQNDGDADMQGGDAKKKRGKAGFSPMKIKKDGQDEGSDGQEEVEGRAVVGKIGSRVDRFGNAIVKTRLNKPKNAANESPAKRKEKEKEEKKNRHKICFLDKIDKDADLIRVHYVLSYKKYNALNTYDPYDAEDSQNHSHCCTIF